MSGAAKTINHNYISFGFDYGIEDNPLDYHVTDVQLLSHGFGYNIPFDAKLTGLQRGKRYRYCAYTYDGQNYNYGQIYTFTLYDNIILSSNSVSLKVSESTTINITSGSGSYSIIDNTAPDVVTATVSGSTISLEAHKAGPATNTVKDTNSGQTAKIEETVTAKEPSIETETFTVNGVSFTMVAVEGGTFMMGAPSTDNDAADYEKPQHQVTLSSYSIGQTEVT